MGNLVFLISFYLNHLPIEHTLSSVNVCSCMTRLVCFRNLNVFYLVLRIPYLYMMHYDQSHSHCPLTSPSHSWWLPTFVSFFCAVSAAYLTAAVIPYAKGRISYHLPCFSASCGLFNHSSMMFLRDKRMV